MSRHRSALGLLLPFLLIAGCISPIDPDGPVVWDGTLQPAGTEPVTLTGSVAMLAHSQSTQLGIGVEGADPGTSLRWELRLGNCTAQGATAVDPGFFPAIEVGQNGTGVSDLILNGRVDTRERYAVWVRLASGNNPEVACAQLNRQGGSGN